MTRLKSLDLLALGFMTFALFLGAGNIIFPPSAGMAAGANVWSAAFGFLITGVGLPLLTVVALARVGGGMPELTAPLDQRVRQRQRRDLGDVVQDHTKVRVAHALDGLGVGRGELDERRVSLRQLEPERAGYLRVARGGELRRHHALLTIRPICGHRISIHVPPSR